MKRHLITLAVMIVALITLNACCTVVPGKIVYSDNLKGTIEDVGAKMALLVTDDGKVLIYNERGDRADIERCKYPAPSPEPTAQKDAAKMKERDYPSNVCIGLRKGSAVTSIESLTILKTNSGGCLTLGYDHNGDAIQRCW